MSPTHAYGYSVTEAILQRRTFMSKPRLRRALAALTLTFAATFAAAPGAGAAVHPQGARPAQVRTVKTPRISWLLGAAARALAKVGVRIDPDGIW
jgi:hypothetical protein